MKIRQQIGFLSLAFSAAMFTFPLTAQQQGGAQGGATSGGNTTPSPGGTGTNRPGMPSTTTPGRDQTPNRFPEMERPIFLSGKVVLDDGTVPPEPVMIERVCNGQPKPEGYTDTKGRFSFQLGQNTQFLADASVSSSPDPGFGGGGFGNQGGGFPQTSGGGFGNSGGFGSGRGISERDLIGCELRASLPGFRSDVVMLSGRRSLDNPDVGTIVLHRLANVQGLTISMNSMKAPKDAKKELDKAKDDLKKKKYSNALKHYEKAIEIYPEYSQAWFELGTVHEAENRLDEARSAYKKSLEYEPKFINPHRALAMLAVREQKWDEAAESTSQVLRLNPNDYVDAYFYNSVANFYMKNYDEAEKSIREADRLDPNDKFPKISQLLGAILIEKQDYAGAAEAMKDYLKAIPADGEEAQVTQKQISELEKALAVRNQ